MTRHRIALATATLVLLVASCGSGIGAGDLVERAAGTWDCTVRFGEDVNDVTVEIEADGAFTLTAEGGDQIPDTWERDGDEVSIATDHPLVPGFTYQGATDDPEELTVLEADGVTGEFDVDIDGDEVTFTQTEYADGEPSNPDHPTIYECTKQPA